MPGSTRHSLHASRHQRKRARLVAGEDDGEEVEGEAEAFKALARGQTSVENHLEAFSTAAFDTLSVRWTVPVPSRQDIERAWQHEPHDEEASNDRPK